jgi:hypothetical protein
MNTSVLRKFVNRGGTLLIEAPHCGEFVLESFGIHVKLLSQPISIARSLPVSISTVEAMRIPMNQFKKIYFISKNWTKAVEINPKKTAKSVAAVNKPGYIELPDEILLLIFSFLEFHDLLSCNTVCNQWRQVASTEWLWQKLCIKHGVASFFSANR